MPEQTCLCCYVYIVIFICYIIVYINKISSAHH